MPKRGFAAVVLALVVLAGCGGKAKHTSGGETFTTVRTTTTAASGQPTTYADSGDYVNGRHIARLTAFDETSVSFDVVQFLTGDAATQAYQQDTGSSEPPDNDYYVRNQNPLVRTLPLADGVVIRVNNAGGYPPSDPQGGHEVNASTLKSYFDAGPAKSGYFWLTIADGKVSAIEEQFVP